MRRDPHHEQKVPLGALLGAAAVIALSLGLAAFGRSAQAGRPRVEGPAPLATVQLRFEDAEDGSIVVLNHPSDQPVIVLPPRSNGFVRGVMRGMFRARKLERIDRTAPFVLTHHPDGRLTLDDPTTQRHVDLGVFGPTNTASFVQIMQAATSAGGAP